MTGANRTRLLGVVDMGVSSASNVVVTVVAARTLDRRAFGAFAIAFAVYLLVLGLARALVTEPLLIRGHEEVGGALGKTTIGMVLLGTMAAAVCLPVALLIRGPTSGGIVVAALFLPLLLLQDGVRYAAFAVERPLRALVVDLIWLVAALGGMAVAVSVTKPDARGFLALWGAAGAVAAFVGLLRVGAIPGVRGTVAWIRRNLDLGGPFVAEFFAAGGSGYAGLWLLGLVSGLSAVGAVRAGQTIFGPINVLYLGIYVTLVPEGARHASRDVERVRKSMTGASVILVAVAVAATAIALAVPASLGRVFFGDTWAKARGVLLPLGLALCGGGVMAGATSGIRALSAARRSLRTRLLTLPAMVVLPLVGAFIADERGFCIGFAVATWLSAVVWWVSFRNALAIAPRPADEGAALSPTVPEPRPA